MPTVHDLAQRASCALHESSWARPREEANLSQERRGEIAENSRTMQLARARRLGEEVFREDVASARCVRDVDRSARRAASSKGRFLHRLDDRRGVFVFEVLELEVTRGALLGKVRRDGWCAEVWELATNGHVFNDIAQAHIGIAERRKHFVRRIRGPARWRAAV